MDGMTQVGEEKDEGEQLNKQCVNSSSGTGLVQTTQT